MGGISLPKADFGGGAAPSMDTAARPSFGAYQEPSETVVVHFKVLSSDPQERLEYAREINARMHGARVGSKGVDFIITDEHVESELLSTSGVAQKICADVMKRLGIH